VEKVLAYMSRIASFIRERPMQLKRRIVQLSTREYSRNLPQKFVGSILKWWERRGNRIAKFEFLNVLVFLFLTISAIGAVLIFAITMDLSYSLILEKPLNPRSGTLLIFLELFGVFLVCGFTILYVRRVKQFTFKNVAIDRVTFLKWDSRSRYSQWAILLTYQIMFLTLFGYTFIAPYLKTQVINRDLYAVPTSFFLATVSTIMYAAIFLYLTLSLGMKDVEKAAYCFDYLSKIDSIRASHPRRILSRDANYICETGVRKLDRLMLFDQYIGDELDLGPSLSNVFLGLFWGDHEEKQRSRDFLRKMRDRLLLHRTGLSYRLIVLDLIEFCNSTPNLSRVRETLSLNISAVKRVTTLRKLSENSVIITVVGVCIAVISFVASRLFPSK
jgi:hypothetical protein